MVGGPNVGKSSLFNRLVGRRQALVRDVPGVTRDRLYGRVEFERWQATVIDTGGFDPTSVEPLVEGVRRQVLVAVDEADVILFVVDAREGATALDTEIAQILRRAGRPVALIANKVDAGGQEAALGDLYRLGFGEPLAVSAEHARGVAQMLERLRELSPKAEAAEPPVARAGLPAEAAQRAGYGKGAGRATWIGVSRGAPVPGGMGRKAGGVDRAPARLPFLDSAPICFTSAVQGDGLADLFTAIDDVAAEAR